MPQHPKNSIQALGEYWEKVGNGVELNEVHKRVTQTLIESKDRHGVIVEYISLLADWANLHNLEQDLAPEPLDHNAEMLEGFKRQYKEFLLGLEKLSTRLQECRKMLTPDESTMLAGILKYDVSPGSEMSPDSVMRKKWTNYARVEEAIEQKKKKKKPSLWFGKK